jgi:hypothetical protein
MTTDRYSIDGVIESYLQWLEVKSPPHFREFRRRLSSDREAAQAEAVTFAVLRVKRMNPIPLEVVGTGGVDFKCEPSSKPPFVVEVTALNPDAVTSQTGLQGPEGGNTVSSFALNTRQLMGEAINKASQMSGYDMPRVLVIASSHPDSSLLLGSHGATELLTGTTSFSVSTSSPESDLRIITRLKGSAFAKVATSGDRVEPARQSISAILLMTITAGYANIIGLLHRHSSFCEISRVAC